MSEPSLKFEILSVDPHCSARRGVLTLPHGVVQTPTFMPVGTRGCVKGLTAEQVRSTGAEIMLGNTYHLALRPGPEVVRHFGGLHGLMRWSYPILTDSGGFQVFSLHGLLKLTEEGVTFRSHIDGSKLQLTPERSIAIQEALGSDIAMVLDEVVGLPSPREKIRSAMERSVRWAARCKQCAQHPYQSQFAIVQGGLEVDLRLECIERLAELDFPGYAIGGLSVGEPPAEMYRILEAITPTMPTQKPRYLMGVGRPQDLLEGIRYGIDMFDCVMPTRNGRNAMAFTTHGPLRLRNLVHQLDHQPIEEGCPCLACRYSRGYIRHLFIAEEMLGPILLSHHNLTYYQRLMAGACEAIAAGQFENYRQKCYQRWNNAVPTM